MEKQHVNHSRVYVGVIYIYMYRDCKKKLPQKMENQMEKELDPKIVVYNALSFLETGVPSLMGVPKTGVIAFEGLYWVLLNYYLFQVSPRIPGARLHFNGCNSTRSVGIQIAQSRYHVRLWGPI